MGIMLQSMDKNSDAVYNKLLLKLILFKQIKPAQKKHYKA